MTSLHRSLTALLAVGLCLLAGPLPARTADPLNYETTRTKAMGGVCVGLSDDYQALYSNPAGLAQVTDKEFAVIQAEGEINKDYRTVDDTTDGLSDQNTPAARAANNAILTRVMGLRARMQASNLAYYLGGTGFGVGVLYQGLAETEVVRPTNPRLRAHGLVDTVLSGSMARPIPGVRNVFADQANGWWGASVKFLSRRWVDREFDPRDFAGLTESDLRGSERRGETFDFDAGTHWELKNNPWRPRLGMLIRNVFETEIDPAIGKMKREWAVGCSFRPLQGPEERWNKLVLAADFWNPQDDGGFMSHLRLGGEAWVRPWLALRGGVRGGYLTGGCSADFEVVRLDFSSYGEEIGARPGDREDRRYSLSLGIEF